MGRYPHRSPTILRGNRPSAGDRPDRPRTLPGRHPRESPVADESRSALGGSDGILDDRRGSEGRDPVSPRPRWQLGLGERLPDTWSSRTGHRHGSGRTAGRSTGSPARAGVARAGGASAVAARRARARAASTTRRHSGEHHAPGATDGAIHETQDLDRSQTAHGGSGPLRSAHGKPALVEVEHASQRS